ncbi:MAG: hypothetical protein NZU63_01750 [Gemmataceae bacterium]|nr:hypothetical protein [Gemmataceae bacterium]MDW8243677.1 hypothetical protein [Thermogemmata sp.]
MTVTWLCVPLWAEMQRRGWFPLWLALLLGVAAAFAVARLYLRESARLRLPGRLTLALIRITLVLLIAFLLLRPAWVHRDERSRQRPIAILIDISQSMGQADARPNADDQWRIALAWGLIEPGSSLPTGTPASTLTSRLPERPTRLEIVQKVLTHPKLDLLNRLSRKGPLEVYTFGTQRMARSTSQWDWLTQLQPEAPGTALADAAAELLQRDELDTPAAIVILTDGRDNASLRSFDDLARQCQRRGVPLHIYGVGTSSVSQIQAAFGPAHAGDAVSPEAKAAAGLDVPSTLFVDDIAAIPVRYTVQGVAEGTVELVLWYGEREVARKSHPVRLTPEEQLRGKTYADLLRFVPIKADAAAKKQEYVLTVTLTAGTGSTPVQLTTTISRAAQVIDRKLKVLVIDSRSRYDFQYLQRWLLRDRRVDARFYLTDGDKAAMRSGFPWLTELSRELNGTLSLDPDEFRQLLFDFDLLILGDVPKHFFTRQHAQLIQEFVTEGGGLIHVAGRWHAPAGWADRSVADPQNRHPLLEILPVELDAVRFPMEEPGSPAPFVPVPAPTAIGSPLLSLLDDPVRNAALWGEPGKLPRNDEDQLKPMYWYYPVRRVKPAAEVFLVHPVDRTPPPDNKPMPLMVGHFYGKGYVLFIGFCDTWRWRYNTRDKYFGRFWSQAVYTAGIPRLAGTRRTQLTPSSNSPVLGTSGEIYARIYDDKYQPLTVTELPATLRHHDSDPGDPQATTTVTFRQVPGAPGEYVAIVPYQKTGRFELTLDPGNGQPATLRYTVVYPERHELAPGPMAEAELRRLAADSRGGIAEGFYREEDLHKLPEAVQSQLAPVSRRQEVLLWNHWVLLLILGLLTAEWLGRRLLGLS